MDEYILELCRNKALSDEEKKKVIEIFADNEVDPNFAHGYFLTVSSIHGNYDMIYILKNNNCIMNIDDNEPLRICAQNNYIDCSLLLFDETINIENYKFSSSYDNLVKIKHIWDLI